jgi:hypothetical protein
MLIGLVAFSVVGCYAYYPPQEEVFEEMRIVRAEALSAAATGNVKVAEHWITVWDDWTRKLQVGCYLRTGRLSDYQRIKARILRDKLELLEHEVAEGDDQAIRQLMFEVREASRRLRAAFPREAHTTGPARMRAAWTVPPRGTRSLASGAGGKSVANLVPRPLTVLPASSIMSSTGLVALRNCV